MNESTAERVGKMTSVDFYDPSQRRSMSEVKNFSSTTGLHQNKLNHLEDEQRKMREMQDFYQKDFPLHQVKKKKKKRTKIQPQFDANPGLTLRQKSEKELKYWKEV